MEWSLGRTPLAQSCHVTNKCQAVKLFLGLRDYVYGNLEGWHCCDHDTRPEDYCKYTTDAAGTTHNRLIVNRGCQVRCGTSSLMLTPIIPVHQDHDDTTLDNGREDLVSVSHLADALEGDFANGSLALQGKLISGNVYKSIAAAWSGNIAKIKSGSRAVVHGGTFNSLFKLAVGITGRKTNPQAPLRHSMFSSTSMLTFSNWRPKKMMKQGNRHVSTTLDLLATRWAELGQLERNKAEELLAQGTQTNLEYNTPAGANPTGKAICKDSRRSAAQNHEHEKASRQFGDGQV
ncbi:hypothetical protein BJV74DRAFT_798472 [Russula compacta]|nr:hypothetical protein BJV74DRAFT_798472 [Russula compacta]